MAGSVTRNRTRSFVDLFYLAFQTNQKSLPTISNLSQTKGWCVGDAHAENFGILLQQNLTPLFTMNDVDDSGPCPVALDLYRFMVSSRLYDANTKLDKLVQAYVLGLQNKSYVMPSAIQDMMTKAVKKGTLPSDSKVQDGKIIRDSQMTEISADEKAQILQVLKSYNGVLDANAKLLDVVATSKIGGGSGGLLRYEVLLDSDGSQLHLEMKEEVQPSIYPVATTIPNTTQRIATAIQMAQGSGASKLYRVVNILGKDLMIRPRFAGNIGISLDKQTVADNKKIIRFEAYTLGLIHSHSVKDITSWINQINDVSDKHWENDVSIMADYFNQKFKKLK